MDKDKDRPFSPELAEELAIDLAEEVMNDKTMAAVLDSMCGYYTDEEKDTLK